VHFSANATCTDVERRIAGSPGSHTAAYSGKPGPVRVVSTTEGIQYGEMRVSSLLRCTASGPRGARQGPHRHKTDVAVVTPQLTQALYTPSSGLAEAVLVPADSDCSRTMMLTWAARTGPMPPPRPVHTAATSRRAERRP
jgi:hypothetical protein